VNRLGTRLLLAMSIVAVVALTAVPIAQLVAERATLARLPIDFRVRVTERTAPPALFGLPPARRVVRNEPETLRGRLLDARDDGADAAIDPGVDGSSGDAIEPGAGVQVENARLFALLADFRATQRNAVFVGVAFALLVGAGLAWWLSRSIARPIEAVSRASSRVALGELTARVAPPRAGDPQETHAMARDFNAMAAALERNEGERRAMIADIAHELRTPLASLALRLEALEDGLVPFNASEVALLKGYGDLLTRLVDDLRLLSLADAGRLPMAFETIDLVAWTTGVVAAQDDVARRRGIDLSSRVPASMVQVRADPQRLQQVLANLIDNALKLTPAGGRVEVIVEIDGDDALLRVRDGGPGVAADERETIFERFVQGRPRDTRGPGGSGLGLAIVRTLVGLHGGTVGVQDHEGGADFVVRLPRPPA
jgi:two-component system, OmpR family, sensor histidine kinase BaeS